jgi:hypothetical protein
MIKCLLIPIPRRCIVHILPVWLMKVPAVRVKDGILVEEALVRAVYY